MNPGYRAPSYAEIVLKRRRTVAVYVTSSFRSRHEFHIYKSTDGFIHVGILPFVRGSILSPFSALIYTIIRIVRASFRAQVPVSCYEKLNTLG